jgi:hypothetical protein
MAELKTARGDVVLIDDEDLGIVGRRAVFLSKDGYPSIAKNNSRVELHRLLMGCPKGLIVDHINRNRLDCRRKNLRLTDAIGNSRNRSKQSGTSSRFKGVTWNKDVCKWQVLVRGVYVGIFNSEEDAARAYDNKASSEYGPLACTNHSLGLLS